MNTGNPADIEDLHHMCIKISNILVLTYMFGVSGLIQKKNESKYSKNGHLTHNWYWTIGREMNDIEIHVNSIIGS